MTNLLWDLLGLRVCWLLAVPQPALCLISEDSATAILESLDDVVEYKITSALAGPRGPIID